MDDNYDDLSDLMMYVIYPQRVQRPLKDRLNPLHAYDDLEFFMRHRVNKQGFTEIFSRIEPKLKCHHKNTNRPLTPIQQLSLIMRYYASGDFQISIGDNINVHRTTVTKFLPIVTNAIASLASEVVSFPRCSETTQTFFKDYCGLPGICGIVDGTQIPIQSPGGDNAELFRCRKGFFSFNVQIVCDENMKILDIVSGWPGSTHDSRVWNNSTLCAKFEAGRIDGLLLGDSGYPLSPFLMIPYPHPPNCRERGRFNRALCRARCTVERCIGILKRRWPCLSKKLRCKHDKVPDVIVACAVLHNLCIELNQPLLSCDGNSDSDTLDVSDTDISLISQVDHNVEFRPGSEFVFAGDEVRNMLASTFSD
jgi:hypothetical protein